MMAFFVPGVGKKNQHFVQRVVVDRQLEHIHRVVADDAQIAELCHLRAQQQASYARAVNFDAKKVDERIGGGQTTDDFTGSEAYFQTSTRRPLRGIAWKGRVQIDALRSEVQPIDRP